MPQHFFCHQKTWCPGSTKMTTAFSCLSTRMIRIRECPTPGNCANLEWGDLKMSCQLAVVNSTTLAEINIFNQAFRDSTDFKPQQKLILTHYMRRLEFYLLIIHIRNSGLRGIWKPINLARHYQRCLQL